MGTGAASRLRRTGDLRLRLFAGLFALGTVHHELEFVLEQAAVGPFAEYLERWGRVAPSIGRPSEVGVDTRDFGTTFSDDSPGEIERAIVEMSRRPERWHREHSLTTRAISEAEHTEEALVRRWREILAKIVDGAGVER
jgi:hypothetical protein